MVDWTHQGSLGSGRLRWTEIKSEAYWLNALLTQPSSTLFFISSVIFVGKTTGLPNSPGASGELSTGATKTPFPINKKKRNYLICEIFFVIKLLLFILIICSIFNY